MAFRTSAASNAAHSAGRADGLVATHWPSAGRARQCAATSSPPVARLDFVVRLQLLHTGETFGLRCAGIRPILSALAAVVHAADVGALAIASVLPVTL